jgi:hypothetical protein
MAEKPILIRFNEPFRVGPLMGTDQLSSEEHGPFRFSPTGVGFGPADDPKFVPWFNVNGVDGWEPPPPPAPTAPAAEGEPKGKGK